MTAEEKNLQDFAAGKEAAFRKIYDTYVSPLRYFAAKWVRDEETVEDILQETFVSLWEGREGFTCMPAIKNFLYIGVKNRCLNVLRHEKIRMQYAANFTEEPQEDDFLEKMIETELIEMVHRVFEEIPPACKEVYRLSLEGKKHEEIAAELHISVNTVKKYKNNANHYMRKRLKGLNLILSFLKTRLLPK